MATKWQGTVLSWNGVPIGEVTGCSGLSAPSSKIAITSAADTVIKYRPGRRKTGDFTFDVNFNPDDAAQNTMEVDRQAGTSRTVLLTLPSGTINDVTFTGQITNITFSGQQDDIWKSQITVKALTIPVRS